MRRAVATRFVEVPRKFVPWRREALTPDGKLSTVDAFMLSPFLANITPACEAAAGVLVDARVRKLLSIARRELEVFAELFPFAMTEVPPPVPSWAEFEALARA
jgi:hypothetical protein